MAQAALAARFGQIIDLLCRLVAARGGQGALPAPLLVLLWTRLRRAAARFETLATGTATPPRRRPNPRRNRPRTEGPTLPRRVAWLLRPIPEAAAGAAQLRHFLADPEVASLIAADPRFGRILRPLCRALGIAPPPCLRPQPGAAPASRTPRKRRIRKRPRQIRAAALGLAIIGPPPSRAPSHTPSHAPSRAPATAADPARAPPYPL